MSLLSQLSQSVTSLTNRLNEITTNAKKTEELDLLQALEETGLIRVSQDGVSYKVNVAQVASLFGEPNVKGNKNIVYLDWNSSGSRESKAVNAVNNGSIWNVSGNEFGIIYNYKNQTNIQFDDYNPEIHAWLLLKGKGIYGNGGEDTINQNDIFYLGFTKNNYENQRWDLGDIGSSDINDFIDQGVVTYQINPVKYNIFECVQNGDSKSFLYIGDQSNIGNQINSPNIDPTLLDDYFDLTNESVYPPTLDSESGFYDTYQVTDPATLAVADFSAGANFYFIEEINTELMHFAVKQTQKDAAAFDGARVHIDGNNYDIETPTSQNGYDIYLLGSADNIGSPNGNNLPFNVWSFGGGGTGSGNTNLGYNPAQNEGTVTSDTGNDATIPLAGNGNAGLMTSEEKAKIATALQQSDLPDFNQYDNFDAFDDYASFPSTGVEQRLYIARDTGEIYVWSNSLSDYVKTGSDLTNYYTRAESTNMFEAIGNKITDFAANIGSNQFFPTVKAVYDWATGLFTQKGNYNGTAQDLKDLIDAIQTFSGNYADLTGIPQDNTALAAELTKLTPISINSEPPSTLLGTNSIRTTYEVTTNNNTFTMPTTYLGCFEVSFTFNGGGSVARPTDATMGGAIEQEERSEPSGDYINNIDYTVIIWDGEGQINWIMIRKTT
tara:strand:+ start:599 stop:2590 length:1992 start_codon:yes stop_codon:yes gene_type:complete